MAVILLIVGAFLFFTERLNIGSVNTQGRHVKVAGALLMTPALGAFALSLIIGFVFAGNVDLAVSLLSLIVVLEFVTMLVMVALAYILLFNPPSAPRLPGFLGEVQAGIGGETPAAAPDTPSVPAPKPKPAPMQTSKSVLTLAEAARYMGMTEAQVLHLIDEGRLTAARINYRYQIARSQLDELRQQMDTGA